MSSLHSCCAIVEKGMALIFAELGAGDAGEQLAGRH